MVGSIATLIVPSSPFMWASVQTSATRTFGEVGCDLKDVGTFHSKEKIKVGTLNGFVATFVT